MKCKLNDMPDLKTAKIDVIESKWNVNSLMWTINFTLFINVIESKWNVNKY